MVVLNILARDLLRNFAATLVLNARASKCLLTSGSHSRLLFLLSIQIFLLLENDLFFLKKQRLIMFFLPASLSM